MDVYQYLSPETVGSKRTDIEAEIGDDGVCVVLQLVLQGQRGEPRHGGSMNLLRQHGKETYKDNGSLDCCYKIANIDFSTYPNGNVINLETSVTNCHNYAYETAVV
jgi:hypothetical protein